MKRIMITALLIAGLSGLIHAQDFAITDLQLPLLLPLNTASSYFSAVSDSTPAAAEDKTNYPSNFFGAFGCGLLNIFFGLGSYLSNDPQSGTIIAVWQALSVIGVIGFGWDDLMAGTFFNGWGDLRWNNARIGFLIGGGLGLAAGILSPLAGGGFESILLTPFFGIVGGLAGGIIGFCIKPNGVNYTSKNMYWAMFSVGLWVFGAIIGICTPVVAYFDKKAKQKKTAQLSDLRNWNVGFAPTEDGRFTGHIGFTAHF